MDGAGTDTSVPMPATKDIFRREAYEALAERKSAGNVLRIAPRWTNWAYWIVVAAVAVTFLFSAIATVSEYAEGPALVRAEGRMDLTSVSGGTVVAVEVQPGQRVAADQVLVRFYMAHEAQELRRINREFELQLLKLMRDPSDEAARSALSGLRAQRDQAEARVDERTVKAPRAGIVSDVRIRPGQLLQPGDLIVSLVAADARFSVVGLLPARYRPMLKPGMKIRLELSGFKYSYRDLVIDSVGDEVVGPNEARRYIGQELGDAVAVDGPLVLVRARLPTRTFTSEGRSFRYYNGVPASVEVRVRERSVLVTMIPGLRALLDLPDG
jgi:membrane fusion protein (multidrug efflux system)